MLNFDYLDEEPRYHNVFKVLNIVSHKSYFEDFELHFIELNKFNDGKSPIKTALERWITFLKKAHRYDGIALPSELSIEPAIEKAFHSLSVLSLDKEEREINEVRR